MMFSFCLVILFFSLPDTSNTFQLHMKKDKFVKSFSSIYKPKSNTQKFYFESLNNDDYKIVIACGPAGTGKTLFACSHAIDKLKTGCTRKIIITRPIALVDQEDIGFLPGTLAKKMDPWTRPVFDIFLEYFSKSELDNFLHNGIIEISPLAFMRGRTFKDSIIIADEMQNSSPNQMKMLTTRIGSGSKLIITGDTKQVDKKNVVNGLQHFIKLYHSFPFSKKSIQLIQFNSSDVERSEIVQTVLSMYEPLKPDLNNDVSHLSTSFANLDCIKPMTWDENYLTSYDTIQKSSKIKSSDPNYIPLKDVGRPYK